MTDLADETCYKDGCPFCEIASGADTKTTVLWRDPDWFAIFPLEPATLGHTLIIPVCHAEDFWHVEADIAKKLTEACVEIGNLIIESLEAEGLNLITSAGKAAEQTVFHLHMHLVPRWEADGFGEIWPSGGITSKSELSTAAAHLSSNIAKKFGLSD